MTGVVPLVTSVPARVPTTDDERAHDWSAKTGRATAQNLVTVVRALQATPLQAPPS